MNHLEDNDHTDDDLKSLAFTVAFFTLVLIALILLFVYAVIKFV